MTLAPKDGCPIWVFSYDGRTRKPLRLPCTNNHYTWLGRAGVVATATPHLNRRIEVAGPADIEPTVLSEDIGCWHLGASLDGEWIVADTNWPSEGLFLFHVPSGRNAKLCSTGASGGHPQ
ncbi:MAG: hypothetical protein QGH20_03860 [Candidatus Latescibacteria bacterium]|nr:hypothetical protein [Candidatus Latescibacterota bacterium]